MEQAIAWARSRGRGGVAIVGTPANTAGASYNEQGAFALAVNEQLDPGESVYLTPTATEKLALFTFGFYIDAPLATIPETPPDDGYLVAIEPASDRVTPRRLQVGPMQSLLSRSNSPMDGC